jgi:hypothetical protein
MGETLIRHGQSLGARYPGGLVLGQDRFWARTASHSSQRSTTSAADLRHRLLGSDEVHLTDLMAGPLVVYRSG